MDVVVCFLKIIILGLLIGEGPVNSLAQIRNDNRTDGSNITELNAPDSSTFLYNKSQLDNLIILDSRNLSGQNTSETPINPDLNKIMQTNTTSNVLSMEENHKSETVTLSNNADDNIYEEQDHESNVFVVSWNDFGTSTMSAEKMETDAVAENAVAQEKTVENSNDVITRVSIKSDIPDDQHSSGFDAEARADKILHNDSVITNSTSSTISLPKEAISMTSIQIELQPTTLQAFSSEYVNAEIDMNPKENESVVLEMSGPEKHNESENNFVTASASTNYEFSSFPSTTNPVVDVQPLENVPASVEIEEHVTSTSSQDQTGFTSTIHHSLGSSSDTTEPTFSTVFQFESDTAPTSIALDVSSAQLEVETFTNEGINLESTVTTIYGDMETSSKPSTTVIPLREYTLTTALGNVQASSKPITTNTALQGSTTTSVNADTQTSSKTLITDAPLQESTTVTTILVDTQASSKPLTTDTLLYGSTASTIVADTQTSSKPLTTDTPLYESTVTTILVDTETSSKSLATDIPLHESTITTIPANTETFSKPLITDTPLHESTITTILANTETSSKPLTTDTPLYESTAATIPANTETSSKPLITDTPLHESTITTILANTETSSKPLTTDTLLYGSTASTIVADTQTSSKPLTTDIPLHESTAATIPANTETSSKPLITDTPLHESTITTILADIKTSSKPLTTDTPLHESTVTTILVDTETSSKPLSTGTLLHTESLTEAVSNLGITNVTTTLNLAPTTEVVTSAIASATTTGLPSKLPTLKPSGAAEIFICRKSGIFADPSNCDSYHVCHKAFYWNLHFKKRCWFGFQFHSAWKICVPPKFSDCNRRLPDLVAISEQTKGK